MTKGIGFGEFFVIMASFGISPFYFFMQLLCRFILQAIVISLVISYIQNTSIKSVMKIGIITAIVFIIIDFISLYIGLSSIKPPEMNLDFLQTSENPLKEYKNQEE